MWFADQIPGGIKIVPFIIYHVNCRSHTLLSCNLSLHYLICHLTFGRFEIISSIICHVISISDSWRAWSYSLHVLVIWFLDQILGELDIIPFIICHVICRSDSWRAWNHSLHYLSYDLSIRFLEGLKSFFYLLFDLLIRLFICYWRD